MCECFGGDGVSADPGEPVRLPVRRDRVAEGGGAAPHHGDVAGVLRHRGAARVAVEDALSGVDGLHPGRDRLSDGRAQTVRADEKMAGRDAAVGESRGHLVRAVLDGHQPRTVREPDSPTHGLRLESGAQLAPAQAPVPQQRVVGFAQRHLGHLAALGVEHPHGAQRETERRDHVRGIELRQCAHPVARQGQERPYVLGCVGVRLVHGDVESRLV